jgi:hypothetical protein
MPGPAAHRGTRIARLTVIGLQQCMLEFALRACPGLPAQCSRRWASKVFQMRGRSPKVKPTAAPRSRSTPRLCASCASFMPYLAFRCSAASSPSGAICGFSSKGWKCTSTSQVGADALQRTFQRVQAHRAPGAGHVGYKVDLHRRFTARQLGVEQVAQAVAHQVQAQHAERDGHARVDGQQRRLEHLRLRLVEHAAPARLRRLRAQAQVAQRRLGQDGGGKRDGGLHDQHAGDVGQHMVQRDAPAAPCRRRARRARSRAPTPRWPRRG